MNTQILQDALTLIEEGTMSAAAARRNVTQPAFSRRIKALEEWLGVTLVERFANRVELTNDLIDREGELRAILSSLVKLKSTASPAKNKLIIGVQHSLAASVFPEIYQKISHISAVDSIRLRTRNQDEIITLFLKREVDLILSYQSHDGPRLPFDSTVVQRTWRRDVLIPVVGGGLRFKISNQKEPPPGTKILRYPSGSEFGRIIGLENSTQLIVNDSESYIETAFAASVMALVKLGAGVGWVPQSLARDELRRGELITVSPKFGRIPIDVILSTRIDNNLGNTVLSKLIEL